MKWSWKAWLTKKKVAHFILKNLQQNVNYYCNIIDFNYIICGKVLFLTQTKPKEGKYFKKIYEKINILLTLLI